ncbi:MAG TPA: hypothetical protein VFB12_22795 [Ktedonobacteraceae bacterium]|nr:hypothetical protein [Ktedonobacteraceae bacterium]
MAKTLDTSYASVSTFSPSISLRRVLGLRLVLGLAALLGAIVFLQGLSWDIQWHAYIGRDRTLIPPHIMLLSGLTVSGVAALVLVLLESLWARRHQAVADQGLALTGLFRAPLGAYLVGYSALLAAMAFPLDAYWHTLYGIDVALWTPFHLMLLSSMGLVALGATHLLLSTAHLARHVGVPGLRRAAQVGAALALATVLSLFSILMPDSFSQTNLIHLGFLTISAFPLIYCTLISFTLVTAASLLPWRRAALAVTGFSLLMAVIMLLWVQPATAWLLGVEHLQYRTAPPAVSIIALQWVITPVLVAFLIDLVLRRAQTRQWSRRKQTLLVVLSTLVAGLLPVVPIIPSLPLLLVLEVGLAGYLPTVLLGIGGAWLGILLSRIVSHSVQA